MQGPENDYYPSHGGDSDANNRRQTLEREESTTSYPIIGEGYSDTISIVSDITNPTVMPGQQGILHSDEYDNGPPLQIGFSITTKPKKKLRRPSLESPVEPHEENSIPKKPNNIPDIPPRPAAPTISKSGGGAAAKRRQNYQLAMAQLEASSGGGGRGGAVVAPPPVRNITATDLVGKRSLLRKSSDYAASVSVTAESFRKLSLAKKEESTHEKQATVGTRSGGGEAITTGNDGFPLNTSPHDFGFPNMGSGVVVGDATMNQFVDSSGFAVSGAGFNFVNSSNNTNNSNTNSGGGNDATTLFGDSCLFDDDGFPMSTTIQDPFAMSSAFGNDFTQSFSSNDSGDLEDGFGGAAATTTSGDSFFLAPPGKDSVKKKKGRRSSTGTGGSSGKSSSNKSKKKDDGKLDTEDKVGGSSNSSRKKSSGDDTVHHESGGQRRSSVVSSGGKKKGDKV